MSARVQPAELTQVNRLVNQIKDADSSTKKYPWTSLHRLEARDGGLTLHSNDGQVWLTWHFRLVDPTPDVYDIVIPAATLNLYAVKTVDETPWDLEVSEGLLEMCQGPREVKIRQEEPRPYTGPRRAESFANYEPKTWGVSASRLARALKFVAAFVDSETGGPISVVTWGVDGRMVGGMTRALGCVHGLPVPGSSVSFRPRQVAAILTFLGVVEDEVVVTDEGNLCHFDDPATGNRLTVTADLARSGLPADREGQEDEILKIDGVRLREAVHYVGSSLPPHSNQIQVTVEGDPDSASLRLDNSLEGKNRCKDQVSILRDHSTNPGGATHFAVNYKTLKMALGQMSGLTLTGKYYRAGFFYLEDERRNAEDIIRVAMLLVLDSSVPDQLEGAREVERPAAAL